ncbi:hypothetical protein Cme02nite_28410 [Catellatospora methionotrophica]|uniref:Uncharacterized protein n=2 Tax=Catellatospora methionotrophica TaxID=121620 RepID=A0A8J3PFA5_9ACTN|nr:hypothetical protein Cme02nite_28410 [Catellatospora methionotrophica]
MTFTTDVRDCAYVATVADPANKLVYTPGTVFTAGGHKKPEGVYVETKNMQGGLADLPFHLSVQCGDGGRWAVVDAAGATVRSAGASGTRRLGAGRYEVTFGSDVKGCAYTASVGDPNNELVYTPGLVFTAGGHDGPNGVYVETKNLQGGLADMPFHLAVRCEGRFAVVDGTGRAVRSAGMSGVRRLGPGRYEVTFGSDVKGCAYTATVGDPKNDLVYAPGLVFAAGGHDGPKGVYVETKNMQGGLADLPFHLAVTC